MEFNQIRENFTEKERREALKKAKLINNSILIQLTLGELDVDTCKCIYSETSRKYALRKAIILKNSVLIELALEIADEIEGLEISLIKHKIRLNDVEFVRKVLKNKKLLVNVLNDCVKLALQNKNTEIINELLDKGASKINIMKTVFEMGQTENAILLVRCGCDLNFDKNLKDIVHGCPSTYAEIINWLIEQMPDKSLDRCTFEKMFRYARTYGKDHIARHLKTCLEVYEEKFIPTDETESESETESETESESKSEK